MASLKVDTGDDADRDRSKSPMSVHVSDEHVEAVLAPASWDVIELGITE